MQIKDIKKSPLLMVAAVAVLLMLYLSSAYNGLVGLDEDVNKAFANVEAQLQKRFDLVPNLVNIVKGAANFEKSTFVEVTKMRTQWLNAKTPNEKIAANGQFESALSRLLVTFENYPQLKATAAFQDLQTQMEGIENRIAVERNRYNEAATPYNKAIRVFPKNLFAKLFGFTRHDLFEGVEGSADAPEVKFDFAS